MWNCKKNETIIQERKEDMCPTCIERDRDEVGSLKAANYGRLGKWWWRFKQEKEALWVKVIKSTYGRDGGLGGGQCASLNEVWGEIIKAGLQLDASGIIFTNSFKRIAGNGQEIQLWKDKWALDCELASIFPRLFALIRGQQKC